MWLGACAVGLALHHAAAGSAQQLPTPDDSQPSMLRAAALGVLPSPVIVPIARARHDCLELPARPPDDRLQGPHGTTLISATCEVTRYASLTAAWSVAHYQWTSVFTAEDPSRGDAARDVAVEEEAVLFERHERDVRAVWHARFETGAFAVWRSVTPEVAGLHDGGTLLSVMSCVNGTGGCGQEFLHRHPDGGWFPVEQRWLDELPRNYQGRIRHGVRIDPNRLDGTAGFYGDDDPNCCPSQELIVHLSLQNDALVLKEQPILRTAQ
jgi:hypothetical protein